MHDECWYFASTKEWTGSLFNIQYTELERAVLGTLTHKHDIETLKANGPE
jgi:hypothetical protein